MDNLMNNFSSMGLIDNQVKIYQVTSHFNGRVRDYEAEYVLKMTNWNVESAIQSYDYLMSSHPLPVMIIRKSATIVESNGFLPSPHFLDMYMKTVPSLLEDKIQFIPPSSRFMTVWSVRNEGEFQWPEECHLTFSNVDGNLCDYLSPVRVKALQPGQEMNISAQMRSPVQPGPSKMRWTMADPNGCFFGQKLTVSIYVPDDTLDLSNLFQNNFNLNN